MEKGLKDYIRLTLIIVVVFSWLACNQEPTQSAQVLPKADNTIKASLRQAQPKVEQDTIPTYTTAIYKTHIPEAVYGLLEKKLPGWRLPSPDSWEKYWFHAYKKDSALVDYVNGDFNGDSKSDYALLLENEQHAFTVWVLQSDGNDYKAIKLLELNEATLPLDIGLELIDKGKLNYLSMDEGADDIKTIDLEHHAIQVSNFEASAETYYWKDGKYQSVTTGD
ncbi:hypothetical protein EOD41_00145 [Mucilaginibacter limnophilus]|uniref:VCBS repeat-containing protein n=1 Tax=Mucilaginibacter limnophilus TaxID=1932778 RepID=A0A437MXK3_9SPHI|nr:hypothetical protein [Mucilaginibacter limnophilus]RVU02387.1 hypothetical protein EOD41_00145 [Mucilaginibacter limnophilus]